MNQNELCIIGNRVFAYVSLGISYFNTNLINRNINKDIENASKIILTIY